jgi:mRNA deadenylase 3'-5' endonuclease subunit Ccr4
MPKGIKQKMVFQLTPNYKSLSSMPETKAEREQEQEHEQEQGCISCTTFNILAPIYKRLDQQNQGVRESDFRAKWVARNQRILDWLLYESSSIICLQEFWVGSQELVHMYQERLHDAGYITFKLARTNNRGDGI